MRKRADGWTGGKIDDLKGKKEGLADIYFRGRDTLEGRKGGMYDMISEED